MSSCSSEVALCCVAAPPPHCDSGHGLLRSIRSVLLDTGGRFWSLAHSANPKVWGPVAVSGLDLHIDSWSVEDPQNTGGHLSANTCMYAARCIDFHEMRSRKQISTIRPSRLPFGQDSRHWAAALPVVGQGRSPGGLPWPATPPNSNDDRGPEKVYTVRAQPACR